MVKKVSIEFYKEKINQDNKSTYIEKIIKNWVGTLHLCLQSHGITWYFDSVRFTVFYKYIKNRGGGMIKPHFSIEFENRKLLSMI